MHLLSLGHAQTVLRGLCPEPRRPRGRFVLLDSSGGYFDPHRWHNSVLLSIQFILWQRAHSSSYRVPFDPHFLICFTGAAGCSNSP